MGSSSPAEGCEECLTIKMYKAMATPIAPTPTLKGKAAKKFLDELENLKKLSPERIQQMKENSAKIEKMLTFDF